MKHLLIGISLLGSSFIACAGQQVDQTIEAQSDGFVKIEHLGGKAKISGWKRDEVKVVGELGDRTEEFIFKRRGDEVIIKVETSRYRNDWNSWSSEDGDDLEIFIPQNSTVKYSSTNARVMLSEIFGGADIETINGDIEATLLSGRIKLEAVNGDIESKNLTGTAQIETVNGDISDRSEGLTRGQYETVNGDIKVFSQATRLEFETVNGDIDLSLNDIDDLDLTTVNGSIDARMRLNKGADVQASSVGGSIALYFEDGVSARFDIEAHAGGRISNNLTGDEPSKAKYGPRRWLEFSVNGGDAKVDISTVSGRIRLDKR